jgi:hypothetical protein
MQPIECYWIEPTDESRVVLRRYYSPGDRADVQPCPGRYTHSATVICETVKNADHDMIDPATGTPYHGRGRPATDDEKRDDRWPTTCDHCDYVFTADDRYQHKLELIWRRTDTGACSLREDMPPGAMWDADWWPKKGPDGMCLTVKTPAGDWMIDGPANNSDTGWTRSGTPPRITASPSIAIGRARTDGRFFHAFLRDGRLERCGDSEV